MTLKLVSGEGKRAGQTVAEKQRHLSRIYAVLKARQLRLHSPRTFRVLLAVLLGFIAPLLFNWTAGKHFGLIIPLPVAVAVAVVGGLLVRRYSRAAGSHAEHLDRLLAEYEPVSLDDYRDLQRSVLASGAFDSGAILDWLGKESEALALAQGVSRPQREPAFLKRKL